MKVAALQLCASDDPVANLAHTLSMVQQASEAGAQFIATPEVTNCVSSSRRRQNEVLALQENDQTLAAMCTAAARFGVWISVGSLALKLPDDDRFTNRSFMIDPSGQIVAQYDKIHMFDVTLSETEQYRESDGYRAGDHAVIADTAFGRIGMTICYDIRFPHLYRGLAKSGASILLIPAAFAQPTGRAHWEVLLRARAIETGCYVIAAAQTGEHQTSQRRPRKTYGHSMIVSPWGEIMADAGEDQGIIYADLDLSLVESTRARVPSILSNQSFSEP
ncbi:MAG: carbon-nitrogen hydrolase family protein [Rhodobacteraceae bacterium]|jgi:predicted amidohydrolase|nr:carbon-nitrogen hydrolase family protein [Paracoccaceae bacterium]